MVDQIDRLLPLVRLLQGEQLGLSLRLVLSRVIVSDKLHDELIVGHLVPDEQLAVHDWVWAPTDDFVLVGPTGEPLPLANEKIDPGLHLLEAQEVKLSVRFLRGEDEAVVSI